MTLCVGLERIDHSYIGVVEKPSPGSSLSALCPGWGKEIEEIIDAAFWAGAVDVNRRRNNFRRMTTIWVMN